jgi:hypothetical protein
MVHPEREVVVVEPVSEEVVADPVTLVAKAEDEPREAETGVVGHDVPQDRPTPDLDQRFGEDLGIGSQAGPAPSTEDHDGWHLIHEGALGDWAGA